MGLLTVGRPLTWPETAQYADLIKILGLQQFVDVYRRFQNVQLEYLKWGDELEYVIVRLNHDTKKASLALRSARILEQSQQPSSARADWKPEYAAYQLEGVPLVPYGLELADLCAVEDNMVDRRMEIQTMLEEDVGSGDADSNCDDFLYTLTNFPRLGRQDCTTPFAAPHPETSVNGSLYLGNDAILPSHPRFKTLTANIRQRRGRKVIINIPIFVDSNTPLPFPHTILDPERPLTGPLGSAGYPLSVVPENMQAETRASEKENNVLLDGMVFGMGCSCLQVTFQAVEINEARVLYDQLANLCPILMALSAASPAYRGYMCDVDCRWNIIAASVDDRTEAEMKTLSKSRYDTISSYLSPCSKDFNDIPIEYDQKHYDFLRKHKIDHLMAQHIAHLFVRDPISTFEEKIPPPEKISSLDDWKPTLSIPCNQTKPSPPQPTPLDDRLDDFHFETIQSTNWQTLRFKPPPVHAGCSLGWRVEFRTMEVQMSDFENAALTVFVVLLTRAILSLKLNFVVPISKVDENMSRAQKRDAVLKEKFHFRTDITTDHTPMEARASCCVSSRYSMANDESSSSSPQTTPKNTALPSDECESPPARQEELTINQIVNGCDSFPGLIPLVEYYLDAMECDIQTRCTVKQYLVMIKLRSQGKLKTNARWIRDFVDAHPDYRHDSDIPESTQYDLLQAVKDFASWSKPETSLIPPCVYKTRHVAAGGRPLVNGTTNNNGDMMSTGGVATNSTSSVTSAASTQSKKKRTPPGDFLQDPVIRNSVYCDDPEHD